MFPKDEGMLLRISRIETFRCCKQWHLRNIYTVSLPILICITICSELLVLMNAESSSDVLEPSLAAFAYEGQPSKTGVYPIDGTSLSHSHLGLVEFVDA